MQQLSKEIRRDPSQTSKLRNDFEKSINRVLKYHTADAEDLSWRLNRVVDRYLRQGYVAGQIHAALILKRYKAPFKPMIDEDSLSNVLADARITLEQLLDGSYIPESGFVTTLTTRLMSAFNRGVVDYSRQHGITNFRYLTAAGCRCRCTPCSGACDIENGAIYSLADIRVGICPPIHEGCTCVLVPQSQSPSNRPGEVR